MRTARGTNQNSPLRLGPVGDITNKLLVVWPVRGIYLNLPCHISLFPYFLVVGINSFPLGSYDLQLFQIMSNSVPPSP